MNAKVELKHDEFMSSCDWEYIFDNFVNPPSRVIGNDSASTGTIRRDDVEKIVALVEGENDGDDWVGVFKLSGRPVRYVSVTAGCDYTGWG